MRIRTPDDLSPGDWITRHTDARRRTRRGRIVVDEDGDRIRLDCEDDVANIPEGVPLRVLGLSLPYVVCSVLHPGGEERGPAILDVRQTRFARLDPSYVEAIATFSGVRKSDPDEARIEDDFPF